MSDNFDTNTNTDTQPDLPSTPNKFQIEVAASKVESDVEKREIVSTITTMSPDRGKRVVLPQGIDLTDYRRNPVVQWSHMYFMPPVGRNVWIKTSGETLLAKTRFAERPRRHEGEWLPDTLLDLYAQDMLKGFSIGVLVRDSSPPTKDELKVHKNWKDVWQIIRKSSMIEYSCCSIPMNQDALKQLYAAGNISPGMAQVLGISSTAGGSPNLWRVEPAEGATLPSTLETTTLTPTDQKQGRELKELLALCSSEEHIAEVAPLSEFEEGTFDIWAAQDHKQRMFKTITGFHKKSGGRQTLRHRYPVQSWSASAARAHARQEGCFKFQASLVVLAPQSDQQDWTKAFQDLTPEALTKALLEGLNIPGQVRAVIDRTRGKI